MFDEHLTDEQQVELLKKLWKEYGLAIILGLLFATSLSLGWKYYKQYKIQQAQYASIIYERMIADMMGHQTEEAKQQADILVHQFKHTPYATLSAFTLAKFAVDQKEMDIAIQHLKWIIKRSHNKDFRQIARIRLARIYLSLDQTQPALDTLHKMESSAYIGLILALQGDIYTQLKQTDEAKKAYKTALDKLPEQATIRPLLQMKLDNLPVNNQIPKNDQK